MTMDLTLRLLEDAAGRRVSEIRPSTDPSDKGAAFRAVADLLKSVKSSPAVVRTLPIWPNYRPREPTKICRLNFSAVVAHSWDDSEPRRMLERLVLVPILKPTTDDVRGWRIGEAFRVTWNVNLWSQLASDYEEIRRYPVAGRGDELSAALRPRGQGTMLIAKTSGRNARDRVDYFDDGGRKRSARRRGFYLRAEVTWQLILTHSGLDTESEVYDLLVDLLDSTVGS